VSLKHLYSVLLKVSSLSLHCHLFARVNSPLYHCSHSSWHRQWVIFTCWCVFGYVLSHYLIVCVLEWNSDIKGSQLSAAEFSTVVSGMFFLLIADAESIEICRNLLNNLINNLLTALATFCVVKFWLMMYEFLGWLVINVFLHDCVLAIVDAFVHSSVCLSVCLSVRHTRDLYQNGAS